MIIVYYLTFTGYCGKSLEKLADIFAKNYKNTSFINLPITKKKFTVLKSPHIYKKSREQFESFINKKVIVLYLNYKQDFLTSKIFKGVAWSFLGVSFKKTKITKNCFYI
jgi:ribosomal protein S10